MPGQEPDRSQADVLIESLADREAQTPEADVIRHVGPADRAEVDCVESLKDRKRILRHHPAVLVVVGAAPGERLEHETDLTAGRLGDALENLDTFGHDLIANAIAGDDCDPKLRHVLPAPLPLVRQSSMLGTSHIGALVRQRLG